MINANELRLGNKILYNGKYETIHGINYHEEIRLNLYADKYTVEQILPIPLTPEILEKCGCYEWEEEKNKWSTPQGLIFNFYSYGLYILISNKSLLLDHLHQFQNIVALTGEELNIEM